MSEYRTDTHKERIMRFIFRIAAVALAWLACISPAAAQQASDPANPAPAAASAQDSAWKRGRPITIQYLRPQDKRGVNVFETTKTPGAEFSGFKLDFGAAFTSQVQDLSHSNTATPNIVSGVDANQLADIGFGFNN